MTNACPLCGGVDAVLFGRNEPSPERVHTTQVRCRTCGLVFAQPMATPERLAEYYGSDYYRQARYDDWQKVFDTFVACYAADEWPLMQKLWRDSPPPAGGRVAEVGCGMGVILELFKRQGFYTAGCDLSEQAVAWCRSRGHDVTLGPCPGSPLPRGAFDVVCAFQVIEHMLDVRAFAAEVVALAKPGGLVILTSEPISNWNRRWLALRARFRGKTPPYHTSHEHTVLFDPPQLARLLQDFGCRDVQALCYTRTPGRESLHWRLWKGAFRTLDRWSGEGDCIMAVARTPT